MTTKQDVENFLREFKVKMKIRDVVFRDERGKNLQALADLELRPIDRIRILESLKSSNYSEGPLKERLYCGSNMWIFGKEVKGNEIYIKITLGLIGASPICISFHIAENVIHYPF